MQLQALPPVRPPKNLPLATRETNEICMYGCENVMYGFDLYASGDRSAPEDPEWTHIKRFREQEKSLK